MPKIAAADAALGPRAPVTCFRCVVCGHVSAGRFPGRGKGDGSFRSPLPAATSRTGRFVLAASRKRNGLRSGSTQKVRARPKQHRPSPGHKLEGGGGRSVSWRPEFLLAVGQTPERGGCRLHGDSHATPKLPSQMP